MGANLQKTAQVYSQPLFGRGPGGGASLREAASPGVLPSPLVYKKRTDCSVRCKALVDVVALLELVNTSTGINQLLLTGEERMALGADINLQLRLRAAGLKRLTAHAANDGLAVLGMDSFLHDFSPLSRMQ